MLLLENKRAKFDYQILEKFLAGLSLSGSMVKLIRKQKISLNGKFAVIQGGKLQIIGLGNEELQQNVPLLLKQNEVKKIAGKLTQKGLSCVILNIQTKKRWLKAEVAIARGKKEFDKKRVIQKRDLDREMEREMKQ